jgi:multicomponent Na+:H+ antiporter subunit D
MIEILPLHLSWPAVLTFGLPPAFIFFAAAALIALLQLGPISVTRRQGLQAWVLLLTPVIGLVNLLGLEAGSSWIWQVMELELVQLRIDRLSFLFGLLFHLGAFLGAIYAFRLRDAQQHIATLGYVGGALGAVFAGDLISLFFYWEAMALASAFLVWAARTQTSSGAGFRYLAMHLLSGILLLAGAVIHYQQSGQIAFDFIGIDSLSGALILLAFGIKCGFPLLHGWITDAYPSASPSGTVFLSMFTTKVAVYALARGFPGTEVLVTIGVVMALFPIFYAVIENDLRRVLGYSMINQIGFMVVGVGVGTELALNGAVAHAFNEVLFKGLLFMSMGAVLLRVGHVLGSDLGGLYRSMPRTTMFCMVGAASISAFPLFNGFISKSMIMSAMFEQGYSLGWLGLLFASAGVFHHAGIKIPYFAFFAHDSGLRVQEAPRNMLLAMALAAGGCVLLGSWPALLYDLLPWQVNYVPYTYAHVMVQLQLLLFSALAFAWLKLAGIYPPELRSVNLDFDWVYRRLIPGGFNQVSAGLLQLSMALSGSLRRSASHLGSWVKGPRMALALHLESGGAALLVGLALAVYLLLYYLSAGGAAAWSS